MQPATTFYLVRHGQTVWNANHITQGQKDSDLTQVGVFQAQRLAMALEKIKFDQVYSSDLYRARRTAEILVPGAAFKTSQLLRERAWGRQEGRPTFEFKRDNSRAFEIMESLSEEEKWTYKLADDIESNAEIYSRLERFLLETVEQATGKTVLVVSHGGILRSLLIKLKWVTAKQMPIGGHVIDNAGYIRLVAQGDQFTIEEVFGLKKLQ